MRRPTFSLLAFALAAGPALASAQDGDHDGVVDLVDVAPCDPGVVAWQYSPALGVYGMLLFEDLWPDRGDFDFNDAVVVHNTTLGLDAQGRLTRVVLELEVLALGALYDNGLAYQLPVPRGLIAAADLRVDGGPATGLAPWATEAEAVFTLVEPARALFGGRPGWINTDPSQPTLPSVHLSLDVTLSAGVQVDAAQAPFDLFIFDQTRGVEVHRPEYRGTSRLDPALIGVRDDGTSPLRAFVTKNGIPFALAFPDLVSYPPEGVSIEVLYPEVVTFGLTQGQGAQDFYLFPVPGEAFPGTPTPGPVVGLPAPDLTCIGSPLPLSGVCGPAHGAGLAWAPQGAALCAAGNPSAVQSDANGFSWTCQGVFGGSNTACAASLISVTVAPTRCDSWISGISQVRLEANADSTGSVHYNNIVYGPGTAASAVSDAAATSTYVDGRVQLDFNVTTSRTQVTPRAYAAVYFRVCDYHAISGAYVRNTSPPSVTMFYTVQGTIHAPAPTRSSVFQQAVASGGFRSSYPGGATSGEVQIFAHGTAGNSFSAFGVFVGTGGLGGAPPFSYDWSYQGADTFPVSSSGTTVASLTIDGHGTTLWEPAWSVTTATAWFGISGVVDPCSTVVVASDGTLLSAQGSLATGCVGPLP
jgi:LruC domain-containing protein